MDMQKEREAFSQWHEEKHGEYVTWCDSLPTSHIHSDRWEAWQAAKASAVPDGYCVVPKEPTGAMHQAGEDMVTFGCAYDDIYKAMIRAAQEQDQ